MHADGDADSLIVKTAVEEVESKATTVICEDTDVLCMLVYHCPDISQYRLVMRPHQTKTLKKQWDIQQLRDKIGREVSDRLLFAHAFSGCDTTSRIFGIGKLKIMKLLESSLEVRNFADDFMRSYEKVENEVILNSGEKTMMKLYSGAGTAADTNLDDLRFAVFKQKAASNLTQVLPTSLPPTKAACQQHSLRVYFQVKAWKQLSPMSDPTAWGWEVNEDKKLWPVYTDKPPAPDELLKIIRCACKGDCSTNRCSCRKNGLKCSDVCKECRGLSCRNSNQIELEDASN